MIAIANKRIIISKPMRIGDVMLSLPIASALKKIAPSCHIIFSGKAYTQSLIEHYADVDEFFDWQAVSQQSDMNIINALKQLKADIIIHVCPDKTIARLAKKAGIPIRIGTNRRYYNWLYCNKLVNLSRHKSNLHEAQLDLVYMNAFEKKKTYSQKEITNLHRFKPFLKKFPRLSQLASNKFNLILHPKTVGEHIEWNPKHFAALIAMLPEDKFSIFVTGIPKEGMKVRDTMITPFPHVTDLTEDMPLDELLYFIAHCDGLICASTGPVHLSASLGKPTLGLYAPIFPFHDGRWGPVGKKAEVLKVNKVCDACRDMTPCRCINEITPYEVAQVVLRWHSHWEASQTPT